ncbi:MAG TPA: DUF2188 domain-containing protein [Planctomycetota bacterium]|nr:DUF2188 domain-containing protein [Planctomycetota bacterium]
MTEILTYRIAFQNGRWTVSRDGRGVLADFAHKDHAVAWTEAEAGKIGMGRVVIEGSDGRVESESDHLDAAVRDELHLPH